MPTTRRQFAAQTMAGALPVRAAAPGPRVQAEEEVCTFVPADTGAGPRWAYGAPGIVREGDTVFLAGLDTWRLFTPSTRMRPPGISAR